MNEDRRGEAGHDRLLSWTIDWIVNRPERVVAVFLVVTLLFGLGLGNVSTEAGTEQFTTGLPEEEALRAIDQEFSEPFAPDTGSTQLIQSSNNVLSQRSMLAMLRLQHRLETTEGLRVSETSSAAAVVARTIDPSATTTESQIDTIERATPTTIGRAVRTAASSDPGFARLVSNDFNRQSASASATIGIVDHELPTGLAVGAGVGGSSPLTRIQQRIVFIAGSVDSDIRVFGTGVFAAEFSNVIGDSLLLVVPAAVFLIVLFLVIAYRDLVDLLLGVFALGMTIVWTFGFMGLAGIPFSQFLIAVPPLLLAVGIDFGIHAINRYREEVEAGFAVRPAMRRTGQQLVVAFFIVAVTTVIGFLSNYSSALVPIREFGLVASIGIVFTFCIFGVFVPAAKVLLDDNRDRNPIPTMSQRPLGSAGSRLGRALSVGVTLARRAPVAVLAVALVVSLVAGGYATGIDTSFSQDEFLPPEDQPAYLTQLPEPFRPSQYTVVRTLNFLEDNFATSQQSSVTVYVEGPMERGDALASIDRAGRDPPDSFVREGRSAEATSILSIIRSQAERDPDFRRVVERSDRNGDGIPDTNLGRVYTALERTPAGDRAHQYLSADRRSTRVVYAVRSDATQAEITRDGRLVADRYRYPAVATGETVVFQAIADLILESAVTSLTLALGFAGLFLVFIYWLLEGRASLGVANLVPIVVTVACLAGTMRALGLGFNAFTATVLAITIGLGIDYSVHVTHRFIDEYREAEALDALRTTLQGTGGALTGSMVTTTFGIGVLVLAVFPAIGTFGLLTALSVLYSYLSSLVVLPAVLALWARADGSGVAATSAARTP